MTLVPFSSNHFALLASWFSSEREIVQWAGPSLSFPLDADQCAAMLEANGVKPPSRLCWMAQVDQTIVGHCQLVFDWRNDNVAITRVVIAPDARGRSLSHQLLCNVIEEAFAHPSIQRIELNVFSFNVQAIRIYQRVGFISEGIRRAATRVDGERWDIVIMAMLRSEWAHSVIA